MILFPAEVAVMAIHLTDARELSEDVLEALRLRALWFVLVVRRAVYL